jgi:hypothetical protein
MNPTTSKVVDAKKRSLALISLQVLQSILLGSMSFDLVASVYGNTSYQSAGPAPSHVSQEASVCAASFLSTSEALAGVASMPPKPHSASFPSIAEAIVGATSVPEKSDSSRSKPNPSKFGNTSVSASAIDTATSLVPSTQSTMLSSAVVSHTGKKVKFIIPRPGVDGAVPGVLNSKRFVLTGIFPEVGGGTGLTLGKERMANMIESFGGRVTSSVSGKTDFVVVGQDPGRSKVTQAEERNIPLIDLLALHRLCMGHQTIEATASAPPPHITNFSAGYPGQKRIRYF